LLGGQLKSFYNCREIVSGDGGGAGNPYRWDPMADPTTHPLHFHGKAFFLRPYPDIGNLIYEAFRSPCPLDPAPSILRRISVFRVVEYGQFLPLMMVLEICGRQCAGNVMLYFEPAKIPTSDT
jgi:hypothetical protein